MLDAQHVERFSNSAVHADLPLSESPVVFKRRHTSDGSPGTLSGPHNGVEPGGTSKFVLANSSSIISLGRGSPPGWRRHAAPLKSPATTSPCSCNTTVRTARSNFFPIPRFLAKWLLMCSDTIVKKDLPLRGSLRNEAWEMTACKTHPDCPSLTI